jgi:hypothetical protein
MTFLPLPPLKKKFPFVKFYIDESSFEQIQKSLVTSGALQYSLVRTLSIFPPLFGGEEIFSRELFKNSI